MTQKESLTEQKTMAPRSTQETRERLIALKASLQSELQQLSSEIRGQSNGRGDEADRAFNGIFTRPLETCAQNRFKQMEKIDEALERIDEGTYGFCKDCGEPIDRKRLEKTPFADRCTDCKSKVEVTQGRAKNGNGVSRRYNGARAYA